MAYGIHHTIEIYFPVPAAQTTPLTSVVRNWFSYQRAASFDQHERFTYGDTTYHVCVNGRHLSRAVCERFALAVDAGKVTVFDLTTLGVGAAKNVRRK